MSAQSPSQGQQKNDKCHKKQDGSSGFWLSRLHSLTGVFLVLFLIEHLITNSQAALWLGDDGKGFVDMVNWIHALPYLSAIEIGLLALPFAIHMFWGVLYLRGGEGNSTSGLQGMKKPILPFHHNYNYSWQRLTAWMLLLGVVGHIVHMRIMSHPLDLGEHGYGVVVEMDRGLYTVAPRLGVEIYSAARLEEERAALLEESVRAKPREEVGLWDRARDEAFDAKRAQILSKEQEWSLRHIKLERMLSLLEPAKSRSNHPVVLVAKDFGTAAMMMVRDAFKNTLICWVYTIYVLAAVFHGFNGLWTAGIVWGFTPSQGGQSIMMWITRLIMVKFGILGLCAIWLTYFNLAI